jgi:hypothetical protein
MFITKLLTVSVLAGFLVSCASYRVVWDHGGYFTDTESSAFRFSGADRDFRTSIVGNPFDTTKAETERAVIAAMQGQDKGLNTNFTLTSRTNYKKNHIVMMFNPPNYFARNDACSTGKDYTGKNKDGTMVLAAIYCDGDRLLYSVAASRAPIKSPQDPELRRFVIDIMDFFVPQTSFRGEDENDGDND